jgi:hypothetical protein
VPPRLLPVGDDVDPCTLLFADGDARCIALRLGERVAVEPPSGEDLLGVGEPAGCRRWWSGTASRAVRRTR